MSTHPRWNEASLSEDPAVDLLKLLGYRYVPPEELEEERSSLREAVLSRRLARALRKLNPWISDDNAHKATRAITHPQAASLLEANQAVHTALAYGISLEQDLGAGRKSQTVRFLDFDDPDANDWIVTRQYRVKGAKRHIVPDVVVFANGLPLAVVECKSPTIGERWLAEAVDQLHRYQETHDSFRDLGAPQLFQTIQLTIATCGQDAVYGTTGIPQRSYAAWKIPYPLTEEDVARRLGKPRANAQEVLFFGLLDRANLLDLLRDFVTFERDPATGRTVKKIPRYQQYAAVHKAVTRATRETEPDRRGGVVWHTQGSGKSLTMLWLATKLRRDPTHENPTLVVVTDRRDLDDQITRTFRHCGFPNPQQAGSIAELRRLLEGPGGRTILTTVQKFQEIGGRTGRHPVLSAGSNVFVLTDEAHRTQYGSLAANLRTALPNAVFFAFTGTPIDKKDRSTLRTFGPYVDTYTIQQAVADGATVPILYESRLAELHVAGAPLDRLFERVFADRTPEERRAIQGKYVTEQAIAETPRRIESVCLDLLDHYARTIEPGGFKAQIVTGSREAAVAYKEALDRLNAPPSAVIMSGTNKDPDHLVRHHTSPEEKKELIRRFLSPDDPLAFLIVCDMLLTGFDAPVEQAMYLDAPLREHTLLQAIARVNRTAEGKNYGLVVDYWGVSDELQEALSVFAPEDVMDAMVPRADELPRLQSRHAAAMAFFGRVRDRADLEACLAVLEPEDVRAQFDAAFRRFSQSMDILLPDPKALDYLGDLRRLGKVRQAARARFRDPALDLSGCAGKVRALIEEAIYADEVRVLLEPVSLFSPRFEEKLAALQGEEAKASEMEHALRAEIHVHLDEDPVYYESLRERIERLIEDRKARRIDAARQLELLDAMVKEMRGRRQAAEDLGMTETALALYGVLAAAEGDVAQVQPLYGRPLDPAVQELASLLEEVLAAQTQIVDWTEKEDVQREMRRLVKRQLRAARYPEAEVERLAAQVLELLRAREGR